MKEETPKNQKTAWEVYSEEEKLYYKKLMVELCAMRELTRKQLDEFDGKNLLQSYDENRKADLGFNDYVDDPADFRVTSGLTREKDSTLLSTLLSYNLQPQVTAFSRDNTLIDQLGTEMADLVKKSREIESYTEKRISIYRELIAQGFVYVEEVYIERAVAKKSDVAWSPAMKISEYKGDDKPIYDIEGKCEAKLHLGKYVLVSSLNEEEVQNLSAIATYEELDRAEAEAIYGKWDRWELVPDEVEREEAFEVRTSSIDGNTSGSDYIWNTYKVGKGKVGVTKVLHRFSNEAMILLNGVMVLPVGFPLTKLSPSGFYNISRGIGERIPKFGVGKGIPSKTKVDQKMYDAFLRAMVGKAWQSFKPTLGNRSGNVLSRDLVTSGKIIHGLKQNDVFPILPTQLLTLSNSDVSMFQLVKDIINEKSVSDAFGAQDIGGSKTATEVVNQQKQTILKMAALMDGVRSLERRMILLRIYNIIANWTKYEEAPLFENTIEVVNGVATITGRNPVAGKTTKKYKKYTQDVQLHDGKQGFKISQFVAPDEQLPTVREQQRMEEKLAKQYGKQVRISYINAEWLRQLEAVWNIETILASENDDAMQLLVFIDNLTRVANLFGVQVFKQDYVLQRIANKMKEDYDKMFQLNDNQLASLLGQAAPTQAKNPAQQAVNSRTPTPLSTAKVA